jgi:hypothetical protein
VTPATPHPRAPTCRAACVSVPYRTDLHRFWSHRPCLKRGG